MERERDAAWAQINASLARLQVDRLDLLQLHAGTSEPWDDPRHLDDDVQLVLSTAPDYSSPFLSAGTTQDPG